MAETWLPFPADPRYSISDHGRFRGPRGPLKTQPDTNGYHYVQFGDVARNNKAHRLVAQMFLGDITGMDVDHLDDDPGNNHVSNLEIVTHAENMRRYSARRTHCKQGHKLTPDNTFSSGRRKRACRTCDRATSKRRRDAKRVAA